MTRLVVVAAAVAGAVVGCRGPAVERHDDLVPAALARADRVVLTGVLHAVSAVELVVPSTDQQLLAIRWLAADGAAVKAGDPVIAFDTSPFAIRLQDGRTQLRQAEQQLRLLRDASVLQLADKQLAVRRQKLAVDKATLAAGLPADLMTARAAQTNQQARVRAEASLRGAEHELAAATVDVQLQERIKQIEVDKTRRAIATAEQAIRALVVTAPRDGVVVVQDNALDGHKFHAGATVSEATSIAVLPDLTRPIEVRAELSDIDDGRIQPGQVGACTLDAYPDRAMRCSVEAIAPIARGREGGDSLRRMFTVTLALAAVDPARLRPGMAVKVELPAASAARTGGAT